MKTALYEVKLNKSDLMQILQLQVNYNHKDNKKLRNLKQTHRNCKINNKNNLKF